jgi:xyloglucan 6-xylosyltransferase
MKGSLQNSSKLANYRITLLCGFITILVLRGTTGRSAATVQQLEQLPRQEELAVELEKEKARELAEEKDTEWDPAVPFELGPKISNWDEQRATWLRRHPGANATATGKPKVLLVTGSQPQRCQNPMGNFQLLKALKNKLDYCRLHDIQVYYNLAHLDLAMNSFWVKLPLIRKMMLTHPNVEWIWWMDSDALFTDMLYEVPFQNYENFNMILNGAEADVYTKKSWLGLNAGIFLIRNCQWSLDLMDAWAPMGPKGAVRYEFGKVLAEALSDRPAFESDDQSALVYLLNADRARWGAKVMLESAVGLHGYWVMLVERYEELMAKGKPGGGGGEYRWPFVTHFVGCKFCGKGGDGSYPVDRCLKHMERAFNFADNQILESYGFQHDSLSTNAVHRVRHESSDPLKLVDQLKAIPRIEQF